MQTPGENKNAGASARPRTAWLAAVAVGLAVLAPPCRTRAAAAEPQAAAPVVLENDLVRYAVGPDGYVVSFADKRTGKDYRAPEPRQPFALLRAGGKVRGPSACSIQGDRLTVTFAESGATAAVKVTRKPRYLVLEVVSVSDPQAEELVFGAVRVTMAKHVSWMSGLAADDEFAAGVRALNLQATLRLHGGAAPLLEPVCTARHGLAGAKVALVGCPAGQVRPVLQDLVREEGLPWSPLGGPFALDAEENRGSYVFAYVTEQNVDEWIRLARQAGLAQIHLIGWEQSLGHYEPRKDAFPSGLEGLKAVVAKIHAAGLKAGMHVLTGGIAPHDPFVTPAADPRLAADGAFALAAAIGEADPTVPTAEPPGDFDVMWAYSGRGNVLRIEEELIQYTGLAKAAPYGFTGCGRGAFGTRPKAHPQGAAVQHLFVRYGTFQPDENSTLVDDVAECIARRFNACGFDMIYMDGAEGMPGGAYGIARMREVLFRRLQGRVLVEASEWGYLSWPFHSRLGAYDHPNWGLKRFVDIHCDDTDRFRASSLLAAQLGWWAILGPDADHPAEFPDEVEYLCAKALAMDAPLSFQGIQAGATPPNGRQDEYLEMIGRYERLRLARAASDAVRARLRTPREEFRLRQAADGAWQFIPTDYAAHKVTGLKDGSDAWTVRNRFGPQPLRLRIEALYAAAPYDSPQAVLLAAFDRPDELAVSGAAAGVTASWAPSTEPAPPGATTSGRYAAASTLGTRAGAWAAVRKTFTPPVDLSKCGALGVWIHGDGKGELLNFQLTNPVQFWPTWDEHYVDVDFQGWRYVELLLRERDAQRHVDYTWPYGGASAVFRSPLIRGHTSALTVYVNHLPPGETAACRLGPVKALPVAKITLANPAVSVGGARIVFPVTLESGQYLEFESAADCRRYDERAALLGNVTPQGDPPPLAAGENRVTFTAGGPAGYRTRANVTVITQGEPFACGKAP